MARKRQERTQAPIAPPSTSAPASPWILDRPRDLLLLVGAPLWIAPLVYVVAMTVGDRAVNDWVLALGAIGHHVPGLLRAYGDRALRRRFALRFALAPLFLGALCLGLAFAGLHAMMLIAFAWGVWHALMQTYGFARIYGGKAGVTRLAGRLDLALLGTWFAAGVILSPLRLHFLLDVGATCGVPLPSPSLLLALRVIVGAATIAATLAWLIATAVALRRRSPVSAPRVILLVSSIAFWCFANVRVRHPLLGMPLFEIFHDAQYLAIVWAFNRRRVDAAPTEVTSLVRALFRPRALSLVAYVAIVIAYGALGLVAPTGPLGTTMNALLTASQLLHFYYDGFIWRVREPATGSVLGLRESGARAVPRLGHALTWSLLLVPSLGFAWGEARASIPIRERIPTLAALFPESPLAQFPAAELHWERKEVDEALEGFRRTLALDPSYLTARENLALSLGELADRAAAAGNFSQANAYIRELDAVRGGLRGEQARWAAEFIARHPTR